MTALRFLDPTTVARLVAQLSSAETNELHKCAREAGHPFGPGDEPLEYCARVSEWLRRRFPTVQNVEGN